MNIERLRELLEAAVKLELATIPPYLSALYSIHPGTNLEATMVVRSVAVEEMLHMILAGNVLNAIGGRPRVSGPEHAPHYPHELPDGVILDLLPFSPAAVESFLQVENPEYKAEHQAAGAGSTAAGRRCTPRTCSPCPTVPTTIGAFYAEIVAGLREVAADIGEEALFCGDPTRQIGGDYYYAAGGAPIVVTDLDSACRALEEVVEQGEGDMSSAFDADDDLAHYYRFEQLKYARSYQPGDGVGIPTGPAVEVDFGAVYPMVPNPRMDELADPDLRAAGERANREWSLLLDPDRRGLRRFAGRADPGGAHHVPAARRHARAARQPHARTRGLPRGPHLRVDGPRSRRDERIGRHPIESEGRVVIFPSGATRRTQHQPAAETLYDAVVVGAGISGAIIANQLSRRRQAGPGARGRPRRRPSPSTATSPTSSGSTPPPPRTTSRRTRQPQRADAPEHRRPQDVARTAGHRPATWCRTARSPPTPRTPGCSAAPRCTGRARPLRMLPEDFETAQPLRAGPGLAARLRRPRCRTTRRPSARSASRPTWRTSHSSGCTSSAGYVFPMKGLPLSYLDQIVAKGIDGTTVELGRRAVRAQGPAVPAGPQRHPQPGVRRRQGLHAGGRGEHPPGRGGRPLPGQHQLRPALPGPGQVQRRQDARQGAPDRPRRPARPDRRLEGASSIPPPAGSRGIEYKAYDDPSSPEHATGTVAGRIFVLAANAIENARLMLASGLPSCSGLVGRNLMDHAYLLSWALHAGDLRHLCAGRVCTGGIADLRGGCFRRRQAAFSVDIHNDGWGWATGSPYTDLVEFVDDAEPLRRGAADGARRPAHAASCCSPSWSR